MRSYFPSIFIHVFVLVSLLPIRDANAMITFCENTYNQTISCQCLPAANQHLSPLRQSHFQKPLNISLQHCSWSEKLVEFFQHTDIIDIAEWKTVFALNVTQLTPGSAHHVNITDHHLEGFSELRILSIVDSSVRAISENAFKYLVNIVSIDLRKNQISELPSTLFSRCTRLRHLYLGHNRFKMLPNFENPFPNMQDLDFSYNLLEKIETNLTYMYSTKIERLRLEGNQIDSILRYALAEMRHLKFLNLSGNAIAFPYEPVCNTSAKETTGTSQFYNWFTEMMIKTHFPLLVDLSRNNITGMPVPECVIQHRLCNPATLILEDNPLLCNCNSYDLLQHSQGIYPSIINFTNILTCYNATSGQTIPMSQINLKEIYCDLRSCPECPHNCSCFRYLNTSVLVVDCKGKNLTSMPSHVPWFKEEDEVELYLQDNALKSLNTSLKLSDAVTVLSLSNNSLDNLSQLNKFIKLKKLELDNNKLTKLDLSVISFLNNTISERLSKLTLKNNPWNCKTCENLLFVDYLKRIRNPVGDINEVICANTKKPVKSVSLEYCRTFPFSQLILLGIFGALIIILISCTIFYFWQRRKSKFFEVPNFEQIEIEEKNYDVFISYSHADETYVVDLLKELEGQTRNSYKICLHSRDWVPGEYILKQMADSIKQSRCTVVILSPSYIQSKWCYSEFRIALDEMLVKRRHRVVVIWFSDGDPKTEILDLEFQLYFNTCTYLRYDDGDFMNKLQLAISGKK